MHYGIDYHWQKSNRDPNLWFLEVFKNLSIFIELDWIFNQGEKLPKYQDGLGDRELKSGQSTLQKEVPSRVHTKLLCLLSMVPAHSWADWSMIPELRRGGRILLLIGRMTRSIFSHVAWTCKCWTCSPVAKHLIFFPSKINYRVWRHFHEFSASNSFFN